MAHDLHSLVTYHMKYRCPDCGIRLSSHIRLEYLMEANSSTIVI